MKSRATGSIFAISAGIIGTLVLVCCPPVAVEATYPVEHAWRVVSGAVRSRVAGLFRGSSAGAENVRLRREVASLSLLLKDMRGLVEENARLRQALGYRNRVSGEWIPAGVLSRNGGAAGVRDIIRIDRGSAAGVVEGAVVVVPEGVVGRVTAVTPHTAEVTLITDPLLKVACEVESSSARLSGILSGGGGGLLVLRHLMGAGEVLPRARVLTSGRGGVFPRGLEVGTLLEIRRDPKGLAREGEVRPVVDYSALEDVFIRREN